jgi:hypothetical protein
MSGAGLIAFPKIPTPELDKQSRARRPVDGGMDAFLEWAQAVGLRWGCYSEDTDLIHPVTEAVVDALAGPWKGKAAGSQEIGSFLVHLNGLGLQRIRWDRGNGPEILKEVDPQGLLFSGQASGYVTAHREYIRPGWYLFTPTGLQEVLALRYGVDLDAVDRERAALLEALQRGMG